MTQFMKEQPAFGGHEMCRDSFRFREASTRLIRPTHFLHIPGFPIGNVFNRLPPWLGPLAAIRIAERNESHGHSIIRYV